MNTGRAKWLKKNFTDKKTATKTESRNIKHWWQNLTVTEKSAQARKAVEIKSITKDS